MEVKNRYKQSKAGVIPEDWEVYDLSQVSLKITDGEHLTPKRSQDGYYLLSARNVYNGRIDLSDVDYVHLDEYLRIRQRCNPESDDILISCSGSIGRIAVLPEGIKCVLVRSAALVKPNKDNVNSFYVQYFLQSSNGQRQIFNSINQGAQANLFINHIEKISVPVPTLHEQNNIATALSDINSLIQSLEILIAKKHDIRQGSMELLLTGKKRLKGYEINTGKYKETEIGVIPEDWYTVKVKSVALVTTGSRNTQDKIDTGEYPFFVRSQTVERINSYSFDGEAILTAGDGVGTGKVFHYIKGKFDFHQRVYKISEFKENIDGYYFFLFFSNNFYKRIMQLTAKSSVDSVRMEMITGMQFPHPSTKDEQTQIATILSDMDTEITALETKLAKYKQIKHGMMQNLLTGRIRLV